MACVHVGALCVWNILLQYIGVIFVFCFLGHLYSEGLEIVSLLFPLSYFPILIECIPLLVTGLAFVLHCVLKDSIIEAFLLFFEFL